MIAPPPPAPLPETYKQLRRALASVVRIFFRRLEVVGLENIPPDRGGILVAWHPNALIDPALILSTFPHQVVFGARHGLFRIPLLGSFMRAIGTVPIYRSQDIKGGAAGDQRGRNDASLDALADRITLRSFSALFPEGITHDAPFLKELKTGAARLYYRARTRTRPGDPPPVVIPVGIHYDQKRVFRSSALVVFHPPIELPPELDVTPAPDADGESVRVLARALTEQIERTLKGVILETESWQLHGLFHRARKLVRAERSLRDGVSPGAATMTEKVAGMARIWVGYQELVRTSPAEVRVLRARVQRYDGDLRGLGMDDHELDEPPQRSRSWAWIPLVLQAALVLVLLPPLLVVGLILNFPPAALASAAAFARGRREKVASIKLGLGIVLYPATWALWGWLAARGTLDFIPGMPGNPVLAAAVMIVASVVGGVVVLRYVGLALETMHAVRVRLTRRQSARAIARLKMERARLCDDLLALAAGTALPGTVRAGGRISRAISR
ncbi:MAG: 1-acyl-sn-glycerol-3-phosphate acyltransferase [Gemmatimonadaceae bacterium]